MKVVCTKTLLKTVFTNYVKGKKAPLNKPELEKQQEFRVQTRIHLISFKLVYKCSYKYKYTKNKYHRFGHWSA